ncbi:MAG: IS21-like element helper ATPase IstB [Acidobacteriaceae bacterium]|nr:IS21-like element helper ATPase IstB [Acidobacteriaceae bacterium]MBV9679956.1 IS21-like element helper ATPase IstB [Acidobacteriaceae bacterium]
MSRPMDVQAELNDGLRELRLPAVRQSYEELARQAEREQLTYEQYLLELVHREEDARHEARISRLLRQSRIPREKNLESFDLKRLPVKAARQIKTLLEGDFLDRRENLLVFGHPGSGKTHALCAVGLALIAQGRKLHFTTSALLVQDLLRAKQELKLSRLIKQLSSYEGLIIDELGYGQQSREEMEVLFTLLAERYERGSVLLSSNLPFSQWTLIFKDAMTTAAAIDRLVHHSVIVELNVASYRLEAAKKNQPGIVDGGEPPEKTEPAADPAGSSQDSSG